MPVKEVKSEDDFNEYVLDSENKYNHKYVLVDFFAEWCGPCRRIAPFLEELSEKYKDTYSFLKVDVDGAEEITKKYGVSALPTFMFFDKGNLESPYKSIVGANQVSIEEKIKEINSGVNITSDF